jgi:hypothetical protein
MRFLWEVFMGFLWEVFMKEIHRAWFQSRSWPRLVMALMSAQEHDSNVSCQHAQRQKSDMPNTRSNEEECTSRATGARHPDDRSNLDPFSKRATQSMMYAEYEKDAKEVTIATAMSGASAKLASSKTDAFPRKPAKGGIPAKLPRATIMDSPRAAESAPWVHGSIRRGHITQRVHKYEMSSPARALVSHVSSARSSIPFIPIPLKPIMGRTKGDPRAPRTPTTKEHPMAPAEPAYQRDQLQKRPIFGIVARKSAVPTHVHVVAARSQ